MDDAAWATLNARVGPTGEAGELRLGEPTAEVLFDPAQLAALRKQGDVRVVDGVKIDLSRVIKTSYDGFAVRRGELLVVRLRSQ
jgi:hypothetical protein